MEPQVLIIAEHDGSAPDPTTLELIAGGSQIAAEKSWKLGVMVLGHAMGTVVEALRNSGVDAVYALDDPALATFNAGTHVAAIAAALSKDSPRVILLGHSYLGIEMASTIAVKLGAPLWSNCKTIKAGADGFVVTRPMCGGAYVSTLEITSATCNVFTVQRGGLSAQGLTSKNAQVSTLAMPADADAAKIKVVGETKATFAEDITQADLLVSVGRGIGQQSQLDAFRDLAKALGGSLSASRPIVDSGWLPVDNQVGLSGRTVRPKVYLAFGISGSAQHMAGMRDSKVIIAINQDANAPIFQIAHYGIVADLFQILPALMDAAKESAAAK